MHKSASSLSATPPAAGKSARSFSLGFRHFWFANLGCLPAVIFGDPQNGQSVANVPAAKLKEYCAQGDGVCGTPRTFQITAAHLSYGNNAADAASFISAATGVTA